jgi:hypothetical protein
VFASVLQPLAVIIRVHVCPDFRSALRGPITIGNRSVRSGWADSNELCQGCPKAAAAGRAERLIRAARRRPSGHVRAAAAPGSPPPLRHNQLQARMAEKYLHAVACRGDLDAVKHCLEHAHPCVDGARTRGRTALWEAAARGHAAVCAALLDAGASPDAEDWSGSSPLVVAARRGRTRAVAAFVSRGHASSTALEAASLKGHDDVVQQLLRAGALPTPTALRDGSLNCFALLCDHAEEAALFDAMARAECRAKVASRIAAHLDEGIERRMFDGEDLRKLEREKEAESKRLEAVDNDEDYWSDVMDSKPCLRRGVAALLRRDVHDDLRDEATRWIVLARVAALCAGKNMEPFALHACTRSFVDGRRTLAFTGFNDGGDPLALRQDVEVLLKNVAATADATEAAVRAVCGLRNREKRLSYAPAPRAALLLRACVARFRGKDEDSVVAGGVVTFEDHQDFCDATLALCDWCWALKPEALPPPPPVVSPEKQPDWCPAGAPARRVHDRRLAVNFLGGGPARVHRRRRSRPLPQQQRRRQSLPKELGRGELLDFYDGGYGLVVVKIALDEEGCTCEFRLKGPVAASTNVGERLLEPVLALPEAPVNFEDLSFVDHPPTAATLLLLADEPVSEDEDF